MVASVSTSSANITQRCGNVGSTAGALFVSAKIEGPDEEWSTIRCSPGTLGGSWVYWVDVVMGPNDCDMYVMGAGDVRYIEFDGKNYTSTTPGSIGQDVYIAKLGTYSLDFNY